MKGRLYSLRQQAAQAQSETAVMVPPALLIETINALELAGQQLPDQRMYGDMARRLVALLNGEPMPTHELGGESGVT